jgi:PLP dependent protein|uniref:YggS family pyridoxal phosphate-dependent enzyme n=1 Tax=Aquiluna sp. TaxID=2053504 RepID=UPI0040488F0E
MQLTERYRSVNERIAASCIAAGRSVSDVELVVVTKNHSAEVVAELYDLGHRHFGENRDQEAGPKAEALADGGRLDVKWHFVGQLQSNKVRTVLSYATCIHSIDRSSLVKELGKQLGNRELEIEGFIELNLTEDPARGGVEPGNLPQLAHSVLEIGRIKLLGVMAVAGLGVDPRIDFEKTLQASQELKKIAPEANQLSMGMSEDFELAIEMGATHIRVGSAITGPRPNNT